MNKKFYHFTLVSMCILTQMTSAAQVMDLHDCMAYAVENSIKVRLQEIETDDARVERRDAVLQAFTPSIDAGTSAQMSFGRTIDPETNTYVTTATLSNNYSVNGGIYLFNGFSAVNNMKISKTSLSMGTDREKLAKDEICLATMEAYYNVVYYRELASILKQQVNTAEDALTLAVRQEELGQKGYAEVVEMEAELAGREYQMVTAENMYADALITLKDLMFWPMDQELEIDYSVTGNDAASIIVSHEEDAAAIAEYAKESLPSAVIAKKNMDIAEYALKSARWQFSPSLYLSGGWSTGYYTYPGQQGYTPLPFWNQITNNQGEWFGVSLSFPIYDRLYRYSNLRRKKNAYSKACLEYRQKMRDIEAEVARAVQDRNGSAASFRQAERRASVQEEAYRLNTRRYEQGLISAIDFKKASDSWLEAMSGRLDALLKYNIKKSVVDYYNGIGYLEQF